MAKKKQPRKRKFRIFGSAYFNGSNSVYVEVTNSGKAFGRLNLTNGSLTWIPKNGKTGIVLRWQEFAGVMDSL